MDNGRHASINSFNKITATTTSTTILKRHERHIEDKTDLFLLSLPARVQICCEFARVLFVLLGNIESGLQWLF